MLVQFHHIFLTNTTPAPIKRWATPLDSAEEGTLLFSYFQFIHTLIDRAYSCYVSTIIGSTNGRFEVFLSMNFFRSLRIFSLITV